MLIYDNQQLYNIQLVFVTPHREPPLSGGGEDVESGVLAGDEEVPAAGAHRPHLPRQQRAPVAATPLLGALALEQVN